jgi:hypothetical protein
MEINGNATAKTEIRTPDPGLRAKCVVRPSQWVSPNRRCPLRSDTLQVQKLAISGLNCGFPASVAQVGPRNRAGGAGSSTTTNSGQLTGSNKMFDLLYSTMRGSYHPAALLTGL